jgi:hypothetical protein
MATPFYSNPAKAHDVLFEMFIAYVRSDDFGNLSHEERIMVADQVIEIKNTMLPQNENNPVT